MSTMHGQMVPWRRVGDVVDTCLASGAHGKVAYLTPVWDALLKRGSRAII